MAAQAASQKAQNVRQGSDEKTWWKLLPKPPSLEESEIAGWKEWSWAFEQYMASVDARFSDDIQEMRKDITKAIDPVDFSDSERQRNSFLYSMLSSLLRQRPLLVMRQVAGSNGLEAYRLLVEQNEPLTKNRSMGLLNIIMNWSAFN